MSAELSDAELCAAARRAAGDGAAVLVTMCTAAFVPLTHNWLASLPPTRRARALVVALDAAASDVLAGACVCVRWRGGGAHVRAAAFGSAAFNALCATKLALVATLVRGGLSVLWCDTDTVWRGDALAHVLAAREVRPADVWLGGDGELARRGFLAPQRTWRVAERGALPDCVFQADDDGLCAGFYLARPTPRTLRFLARALDYVNPVVCDQMAMRRFVDEPDAEGRRLDVLVLDRYHFPNGSAYFDAKLPQRAGVTPLVIHNNCIIGRASKERRFREYGLWLLDDVEPRRPPAAAAPATCWRRSALLSGHAELVTALVAHGDELVSASYDKTLRRWRAAEDGSAQCVGIQYVHKRGGPWALCSARDGELLLTAAHDRSACAWRRADDAFEAEREWRGHSGYLNDVCVAGADDDVLVTCADDGTACAWQLAGDGAKLRTFVGHIGPVLAVAAAGGALFTAGTDGTARAWQLSTARCMSLYEGHTGAVRAVVARGALLYTASVDGSLRVWQQRSGELDAVVRLDDAIGYMVLANDASAIIAACEDGSVHWMPLPALETTALVRAPDNNVRSLVTSVLCWRDKVYVGTRVGNIEVFEKP